MVSRVGCTNPPGFEEERLALSKYRLCAIESDVATRNRNATTRHFRSPKCDSLGQSHYDRGSTRRGAVIWAFQADQFEKIFERLPRIRVSFHEDGSRRDR